MVEVADGHTPPLVRSGAPRLVFANVVAPILIVAVAPIIAVLITPTAPSDFGSIDWRAFLPVIAFGLLGGAVLALVARADSHIPLAGGSIAAALGGVVIGAVSFASVLFTQPVWAGLYVQEAALGIVLYVAFRIVWIVSALARR